MRSIIIIPSYNTGDRLFDTVADARRRDLPVIVVIDGSTDGTGESLSRRAADDAELRVHILPRNTGKGAAILHGLRAAWAEGFTHALTLDADGQHSMAHLDEMLAVARANPDAMVLGLPLFDDSAPRIRIFGHRLANFATALAAPRGNIGDSLFGFRVYPIAPLIAVFESTAGMRRFDFDSEAAIRLSWRGIRAINVVTPVRYFRQDEGGVSHFKYLRDNLLLGAMYARLAATRLSEAWSRLNPARAAHGRQLRSSRR